MPQTVPSAGFTPPCDYSNFAENFDLSLLPGGDLPVSPSTQFYTQSPPSFPTDKFSQPKIFTTFYPTSPPDQSDSDIELGPDFQTLLADDTKNSRSPVTNIYLEVPSASSYPNSPVGALSPYSVQSQGLLSPNDQFRHYRSGENFYPSSPEQSLYTASPSSVYSTSPCREDYIQTQYIKQESISASTSPLPDFSFKIKEENFLLDSQSGSPEHSTNLNIDNTDVGSLFSDTVLNKQIKQESTVDFGTILQTYQDADTLRQLLEKDIKKPEVQTVPEKPKDHQLLREVLKDTSFQKKYNLKPIDFGFITDDIKMEEPENEHSDLMRTCSEQIAREKIEPVLNLAIEQMRKDVDSTCAALGISTGKFINKFDYTGFKMFHFWDNWGGL